MKKEGILKLFEDDVDKRIAIVKDFITNTSNPLEDRYEIYLNTPSHLQTHSKWIFHPKMFEEEYGRVEWFDDFCFNKYETIDLVDLCLSLTEGREDIKWNKKKSKMFVTDCLNAGVHTFELAW